MQVASLPSPDLLHVYGVVVTSPVGEKYADVLRCKECNMTHMIN